VEGEVTSSFDHGKTWGKSEKVTIKLDRASGNAYFEHHGKMQDEEVTDKLFFAEGSVTKIQTRREMKKNNIPESYSSVTIQREKHVFNSVISTLMELMEYNLHSENIPIFKNGRLIYDAPVLSHIEYQGKKAMKILSTDKENYGWVHMSFIFETKTGNVLEKEDFTFMREHENLKKGKLVRECNSKITASDYFFCNGIPFPGILDHAYGKGNVIRRLTVNKKTAKINEDMDRIHFTPVFPPNADVSDTIKGTYYRTPSVGNTAAEKVIAGNLDEIFKKANE
jgi:hypothetical protein